MATHQHDHFGADDRGSFRLAVAIAINVGLTFAQIAGGLVAGSLSLVADALHNLSDAASLVVALVARRISGRPADRRRTFGYRRAETIGALINLTTLIVVGVFLIYEAIQRYFEQQAIDGWIVVIVAGIALAVDTGTALLTYAGSRESMNIRAAFVHNVSDALASLGVMIAGTLILLYDWTEADLVATGIISAYVIYQGVTLMRGTIRVLMESVPEDISVDEVVEAMETVEGVIDIHHLHIWQLDEQHRALEAHVVADFESLERLERIKRDLKDLLGERFELGHCTLEMEAPEMPGEHRTELIPPH